MKLIMVSIIGKRSQSDSIGLSVRVSRKQQQALRFLSLCRMLVYHNGRSRVASMTLFGRLVRLENLLRKSVVSLMCESKEETRGLM